MSRSAKVWLAFGWVGFILLPWHAVGDWAEWLRQLPATTVRLRVTTGHGSEERLLGDYTLAHAGPVR